MASDSLEIKKSKIKLDAIEESYYYAGADYELRTEGIKNPTQEEIEKAKRRLINTYFGLSIILAPPLSDSEIKLMYDAACGDEAKGSARSLNSNSSNIRKKRSIIFKRLQVENVTHAVYRLTRLGYLPTNVINETEDLFLEN
jgi:DNA-binding NarL/FixJ family response regulator